MLVGDDLADLLGPHDLDAVHHLARERRIGVDEGDGAVVPGLVEGAQQLDADRACPVDDHILALIEADGLELGRGLQQQGARPLPAEADETGGDQGEDHDRRARLALEAAHVHDESPQHGRNDHRHIDAGRPLRSDEAGDELVEAPPIEHENADHRRRQHQQKDLRRLRHIEFAEAQGIGGPDRDAEHHEVICDQKRSLEPARTLDQPNGERHAGRPRTGPKPSLKDRAHRESALNHSRSLG